jgi:hypothetical protein
MKLLKKLIGKIFGYYCTECARKLITVEYSYYKWNNVCEVCDKEFVDKFGYSQYE